MIINWNYLQEVPLVLKPPKSPPSSPESDNNKSYTHKNTKINSSESKIKNENITESDSPFLMKDHPFNSILEKIAKIINTYDINIKNRSMDGDLENLDPNSLLCVLFKLLIDLSNLILSTPWLLIIIPIVVWYCRLSPWIKLFREYLQVRKMRKKK